MVIHASILAWKIPWTEESGGPQSMVLQKVGHNGACTHTARGQRERQRTGSSQSLQRILALPTP